MNKFKREVSRDWRYFSELLNNLQIEMDKIVVLRDGKRLVIEAS